MQRACLSFALLGVACASNTPSTPDQPCVQPPAQTSEPAPASEQVPIRMAITVDDLPRHGPLPEGVTRLQIHQKMLAAFKKHGVPQVYGFANTKHIDESPELEAALEAWVGAGFPLANHTYTHPHLRDVGLEAYLADIDANEANLRRLSAEGQDWKVYRYPFLEMGDDGDQARAIRKHLADGGYRIAEVSVDFWDWAFNAPYVRCLKQNNEPGLKGLHDTYLEHAAFALNWAEAAADDLFGRRVPHILLLHAGAFDAEMLDELLTRYEKMGVEFISLDDALADPVYQIVEIDEDGNGGTLFEHLLYLRKTEHPPWFTHPYSLLEAVCSEG